MSLTKNPSHVDIGTPHPRRQRSREVSSLYPEVISWEFVFRFSWKVVFAFKVVKVLYCDTIVS
jgi:hypothetical protein